MIKRYRIFLPCPSDPPSNDNENSTLFIKDKFCLSDEASLETYQNYMQLNSDVSRTVGVTIVKQTLESRLKFHLTELQKKINGSLSSLLKEGKLIRIESAGDGTRLGRSLNFTFTSVDTETAESVAGNHTLAIFHSTLC